MPTASDGRRPAGFWPRAAAYLLDRLLLLVALLPVWTGFFIAELAGARAFTTDLVFQFGLREILCWLLRTAYFVTLTACCGGTLGKRALNLQVTDNRGGKPGLWDILYRESVGRYLSGILCIGYFLAAADGQKRALHDMLCDTRVVYDTGVPRRKKLPLPASPAADWYAPLPRSTYGKEGRNP